MCGRGGNTPLVVSPILDLSGEVKGKKNSFGGFFFFIIASFTPKGVECGVVGDLFIYLIWLFLYHDFFLSFSFRVFCFSRTVGFSCLKCQFALLSGS